ncbi:MAG: glycosyltransferase [Henriciella sp.]|jgi:glycosyltransferase involved in cell wall biosynthesis|nr:glycosyltransferase [Henriciella sp.]MBO6695163.1 glycosyltransferase [Henriciella sp.]
MPEPQNILAYCDKMFTPSESFIPRGYTAFSRLKPIYIGHTINGPIPDGAEAIDISGLHGVGGVAGFKQFGQISPKLEQRLRDLNPVAIHASFGKSGAYALPLARKLGLPLAVTYYGGDATKTSNTKDSFVRVYNRRRQQLWDSANLILPCSDFIRRELLAKGAPKDKMIVHHNTADPEKFQPGEKQNLLVFAGRWSPKKGIDTLIDALTQLGPELDGWTVRLCGNKPAGQRDSFEQSLHDKLAASGIKVDLAGWVPADDMPKHWAAAKIACVPSKRAPSGDAEGLPLVCIEAMLSGCALAATRHSGIVECVRDGKTGYLCDEGDADALAENLRKLLQDPAATAAMGDAGRALALDEFNLQKQSRKLEDHLLRIAGLS